MAPSFRSYPRLDQAVLEFSARLDAVRQDLYYCDVNFAKGRDRELGRNVRAAAYVYVCAAVERVTSDLLVAALAEISAATVEIRKIRLSLVALSRASLLDSLQDVRGLKMWLKRVEILAATDDQGSCTFDALCLPLDGRTIRPQQLEVIWAVFGFSTPPVPSPISRLALNDLADARNSVAHGEDTAFRIAGQRSVTDMLKLIDRIEDIVIHMWSTISDYLIQKEYLRT
jgi:HEPN superfamily RiboL-PSP-like protein